MAADVTLYTTPFCPYCIRAKSLLDAKSVEYTDFDVGADPGLRLEMMERSGRRTVPQIFVNDTHVGGCTDLMELEQRGELDDLLKGQAA